MSRKHLALDYDGTIVSNAWPEHGPVMAEYLGRCLTSDEQVHHDDEDKHNNRIENLVLMTQKEHAQEHIRRQQLVGAA